MINSIQLRELIIQPALKGINLYSKEAEEMLIATCAQETHSGLYLKQLSGGKDAALGIYQMQPDTHDWIWNSTLTTDSNLGFVVMTSCKYTIRPKPDVMVYNLLYASVMARAFWLHVKEPFPDIGDTDNMWFLYKKYWNTYGGKATKEDFVKNYNLYAIKGK